MGPAPERSKSLLRIPTAKIPLLCPSLGVGIRQLLYPFDDSHLEIATKQTKSQQRGTKNMGVADLRYERLNMPVIETSIHKVSGF